MTSFLSHFSSIPTKKTDRTRAKKYFWNSDRIEILGPGSRKVFMARDETGQKLLFKCHLFKPISLFNPAVKFTFPYSKSCSKAVRVRTHDQSYRTCACQSRYLRGLVLRRQNRSRWFTEIIVGNFGFSRTNKNEINPSEDASIHGALDDYGIKKKLNYHRINLRKD